MGAFVDSGDGVSLEWDEDAPVRPPIDWDAPDPADEFYPDESAPLPVRRGSQVVGGRVRDTL